MKIRLSEKNFRIRLNRRDLQQLVMSRRLSIKLPFLYSSCGVEYQIYAEAPPSSGHNNSIEIRQPHKYLCEIIIPKDLCHKMLAGQCSRLEDSWQRQSILIEPDYGSLTPSEDEDPQSFRHPAKDGILL